MEQKNAMAWIRFLVHEQEYALPLDVVLEVTVARRPRLIPLIETGIAGVINVKGEPLPAVDGGALLCDRPGSGHRHALVLERGSLRMGVLVASVTKVEPGRDLAAYEPAEEPPGHLPAPDLVRWRAVDGNRLGLLDPDALLSRVSDLLTRPAQQTQDKGEPWLNAF